MKPDRESLSEWLTLGLCGVALAVASFLPLTGVGRLAAFLLPYAVCSFGVYLELYEAIKKKKGFGEALLMCIATVGAFVIGEYAEAVLVMLLYRVGEAVEELAEEKSRRGIDALSRLCQADVRVSRGGVISLLSPDEILPRDEILLPTGEMLPVDGKMTDGTGVFDASVITGESLPVTCEAGESVYAGYVNTGGPVTVTAEKTVHDSTVSVIRHLTEEATQGKTKAERFISRFADSYTPCVILLALLLAFLAPLLSGDFAANFREWGYRALLLLVVSCPCALVISVPLGFFCGIGAASQKGILIKGSHRIEALSRAKTVAMDKTGTLTEGRFSVKSVTSYEDETRETLLRLAASLEATSTHPIARAIADAVPMPDRIPVENAAEYPGEGLCGTLNGCRVGCGNRRLAQRFGIPLPPDVPETDATSVTVMIDGRAAGQITVADLPKPSAAEAIDALHRCRVTKTVMLTGDKSHVANAVAKATGIDVVRAELLPAEKVAAIDGLIRERDEKNAGKKKADGTLLYVGDGINDAPSLARADVGIAMGAIGADAAIEAADVVLMDDDPRKIAQAIRIARVTMQHVRVNIAASLAVKLAVLLLGASGVATMGMAVFADVGMTVLATLNSLLIFERTKEP